VEGIGGWGQRWIDAEISLRNLDASLLMWDMRRRIDPKPIPMQRAVIQFLYPEQTRTRQRWWLIPHPRHRTRSRLGGVRS